jgi:hypothetical protein
MTEHGNELPSIQSVKLDCVLGEDPAAALVSE